MPDGAGGRQTGAASGTQQRVANEPAFVLHTRPWKETSLIVDLLTRRHGRLPAVAKGARRPQSQLRPVLLPFQPLLATWSGRSEVRLIHGVEWQGGIPQLSGTALLCGFYLNELLVAALARDDPHEEIFDAYADALRDLATAPFQSGVLRRFEIALLAALGYGLQLEAQAPDGAALLAEARYRYLPERGPVPHQGPDPEEGVVVSGKTLRDMAGGDYGDPATAGESKKLMRLLIAHHLGNPPLHSRQLLIEVRPGSLHP
jgi:DNA repair protein RecO (recombination protein O)